MIKCIYHINQSETCERCKTIVAVDVGSKDYSVTTTAIYDGDKLIITDIEVDHEANYVRGM